MASSRVGQRGTGKSFSLRLSTAVIRSARLAEAKGARGTAEVCLRSDARFHASSVILTISGALPTRSGGPQNPTPRET